MQAGANPSVPSSRKPLPLTTVEMQKLATRLLGMSGSRVMEVIKRKVCITSLVVVLKAYRSLKIFIVRV